MTFKEIRNENPVYILDKKTMELKQGKVTATSPHINVGGMINMPTSAQPMVDVTVDVGGKLTAYTIPEGLSVTYAGDIVLATARELLATEVEKCMTDAKKGLQMVEYWHMVEEKSPELLAQLDPKQRERQETERRFAKIEASLTRFGGLVETLVNKLT